MQKYLYIGPIIILFATAFGHCQRHDTKLVGPLILKNIFVISLQQWCHMVSTETHPALIGDAVGMMRETVSLLVCGYINREKYQKNLDLLNSIFFFLIEEWCH